MYYTIQNGSILTSENRDILINFYNEALELPDDYKEGKYIVVNDELVLNPEWEEEQAQKERERLYTLCMTRSDFFDGMIMAFGLDSKELRVIVENVLGSINITPVQIRVALNNYDNALNFYRKHTLFELINGVEIPVSEDKYLLFTAEIWDKFFDTKDYHELQQAIHEVEPEPVEEEPVVEDDNIEESEGL